MKKWFLEKFLPMWAKETVLADNRSLQAQIKKLELENQRLRAYVRGMQFGLRVGKKMKNEKA